MTPAVAPQAFEDMRPRLLAVARSVTKNQADAEDVVQEVWLRYEAHGGQATSASRWLLTVTTNAAIDLLRRRATRREVALSDSVMATRGDSAPAPYDNLLAQERLRDGVRRLLTCLSPAERVALVGREFAELSYGELSRGMQRSEPAVRQLHHRAIKHLRSGLPRYPTSSGEVDAVIFDIQRAAIRADAGILLTRLGDGRSWLRACDGERRLEAETAGTRPTACDLEPDPVVRTPDSRQHQSRCGRSSCCPGAAANTLTPGRP